ncbi:MAG: beta-ketoacyl-ACP synthase III [Planctomycetota bacterium]
MSIHPGDGSSRPAQSGARFGVRIVGSGSALPERGVTNKDLESMMETSDEWIVQRTGIKERRVHTPERGETTASLATIAASKALKDAGLAPTDLDLILVATMTPDSPAPSVACVVANQLGAGSIGAIDINGACSGFVYSMNLAHDLIKGGSYRTIAVIGADTITRHIQFSTSGRSTAVLFGDGAACVVVRRTDDPGKGILAQSMHSDGGGAKYLYIPNRMSDFPEGDAPDEKRLNLVQMNGPAVFKFAVGTFPKLLEQTLEKAGMSADQVDHFVCHQSNSRILEAARERFGIAPEKLHVNIQRFGNTVGASVPLVFDELRQAGRVKDGQRVMFLAFGAGLTWGSSLWQL